MPRRLRCVCHTLLQAKALWLETRADNRSKEVDDVAYEVDCEMIIVKEGDVDIGEPFCYYNN